MTKMEPIQAWSAIIADSVGKGIQEAEYRSGRTAPAYNLLRSLVQNLPNLEALLVVTQV